MLIYTNIEWSDKNTAAIIYGKNFTTAKMIDSKGFTPLEKNLKKAKIKLGKVLTNTPKCGIIISQRKNHTGERL